MNGTVRKSAACLLFAICFGAQATRSQSANLHDPYSPVQDDSHFAPPEPISEANLKLAPPTPIAIQKAASGKPGWDPAWDLLIEKALPPEFFTAKKVEHDVKPLCPSYGQLSDADKRAFWAYFFQALAGAEAGLIPSISVRHTEPEVAVRDTVTHRMVRAEGLLQLTYMDAERYGCDFAWEKDKELSERDPSKTILQPANNLLCGIKILDVQLIAHRKPLLSGKSYWSTLRPGTASYRVFFKQLANVPEICRAPQHLDEARGQGGFEPRHRQPRPWLSALR